MNTIQGTTGSGPPANFGMSLSDPACQCQMPDWYLYSQAIICLYAGLILLAMWWRGIPSWKGRQYDPGLGWLGLAVMMWFLAGVWPKFPWLERQAEVSNVFRQILSTFNSAFLLLGMAHFQHGPKFLKILNRRRWQNAIIAVAMIVGFVIVQPAQPAVRVWADAGLSVLTVALLGVSLGMQFNERKFTLLALFSSLSAMFMLVMQPIDAIKTLACRPDQPETWILFSHWMALLTSKTMVICSVLSLPMSWAYEEWEKGHRLLGRQAKDHDSSRRKLQAALHDGVLQRLSIIRSDMTLLADDPAEEIKHKLPRTVAEMGEAIGELRDIAIHLSPVPLLKDGFRHAVDEIFHYLIQGVAYRSEIDEAVLDNLPEDAREHLYWIVREALANIRKHANARLVRITLHAQGEFIELTIDDDGAGFDPRQARAGMGLGNISSRASLLGAEFIIRSRPEYSGTSLMIRLPSQETAR